MNQNKARFTYLLQESILFLGFTFLLILNSSTNDFVNPDLQKSLAVLLTLAAVTWVAFGQRGSQPAGTAMLVWVAVYLVVLFFSLDPRRSASQMVLMSISLLLFSLSADLAARGWPRELIIKTLLMVGAVILLLGLLEAGLWYARWLQNAPGRWIPDVMYRPGSANVIAMFLNLVLMLAGARLLVTRSWPARLILVVLILPAAFLLYLTSSRGGWLGAAAGLAVNGALAVVTGVIDWRAGWRYLRARPALLGLILAGGIIAAGVGGVFLYQRTLHPSHAPVSSARVDYWPPAWETFLRSPLVGSGQFTYSSAFIAHNSTPPWVLYVHAHGTPFNLLAEMGLAGAAGMLFLVGAILAGLWQQLRRVEGLDWGVVAGALASVAAVGVHSLFDGFHTEPIGLWTLCIALGAALGRPGSRPRFGRFQNSWALLVVLGLWAEVWSTTPLFNGVELANSGRWPEAAETFTRAVQRDPRSVIAWQQRALASSVLADHSQPGALEQAVSDLETVVQLESGWALNHANLGALYLIQGRPDAAVEALEEGLRRAPKCGLCALNLGIAQEAAGNTAAAEQAYRQALDANQPAQAYFWRSTPVRQKAQADWLAAKPPEASGEKELLARLEASSSSAGPYLALAAFYLRASRLEEAEDLLNRSGLAYIENQETELELAWLKIELLGRRGDLETAIEQGVDVINSYRMAGLYGPGSLGQLYYAPLMFRRPAMALELAPQLTRIELPDAWGQRMALLADWAEQSGDTGLATQLRGQLQILIPDSGD